MKYSIAFLTLTFSIILLMPAVIAAEPDFVATQWQNYTLVSACEVGGLVCNVLDVQCNISLRNLDNTYIIFQNNMSIAENGDLSYLFNASAMSINGEHEGFISCSDGASNKTADFILFITPSGENNNKLDYLTLFLGAGGFILLGFAKVYENSVIGFCGGIIFMLTAILIFTNGLFSYQNLYTQGVAGIYLIFFAWAGVSSGYNWIEDLKVKFS